MDTPHTKPTAIALLSGGLDSTVSLALAQLQCTIIQTLTFNYGQRSFERELTSAQAISAFYNIPHQVIELSFMAEILPAFMAGASHNPIQLEPKALTQTHIVPEPDDALTRANQQSPPAVLSKEEIMAVETVWVPNRNGVLLNIAAALAETQKAQHIIFGANAEEGEDFPDNTTEAVDALTDALAYTTLNQVKVLAPVAKLNKAQMITEGIKLGVPFQHIWSCYTNAEKHCGQCASCIRLFAAIEKAGHTPEQLKIAH